MNIIQKSELERMMMVASNLGYSLFLTRKEDIKGTDF